MDGRHELLDCHCGQQNEMMVQERLRYSLLSEHNLVSSTCGAAEGGYMTREGGRREGYNEGDCMMKGQMK